MNNINTLLALSLLNGVDVSSKQSPKRKQALKMSGLLRWFAKEGKILEDGQIVYEPKWDFEHKKYEIPYYTLLDKMKSKQAVYISHWDVDKFIENVLSMGEPNKKEQAELDDLKAENERFKEWSIYNIIFLVRKDDLLYKTIYKYNTPIFLP